MENWRAGHRLLPKIDAALRTIALAPGVTLSKAEVRQINEHCGGFGPEPRAGLV